MDMPISRRDFVKMTGAVTVGAIAGTSFLSQAGAVDKLPAGTELQYRGHTLPLLYKTECCVIGGGPSGTAAAVNAAQKGAKTVLVERGIALGGLQTLGLVVPMMPTFAPNSDTPYVQLVKSRMKSYGIEMSDGVTTYGWTNPETLALVYDALCAEAGVEVLYHTVLVDIVADNGKIKACIVQTIAGLAAIEAEVFVDASGDAMLARLAGVPTESGSEQTGKNQPLSFRFEMGGINLERLYQYDAGELKDDWCKTKPPYFEIAQARHRAIRYKLEDFFQQGVASGELQPEDAEYVQAFTVIGKPGTMSMNCPELPFAFSATEPLSYSRGVTYGRAMIHRLSQYLVKHMPGFEHAYISREATMLGARESWRIRGKYYMTARDYHDRGRFRDAVARTAWYIDAHGEQVEGKLPEGEFYEIPYRALITEELDNLIVAGRCISASFSLQASMRIQPTCMSIGEAAGIAAAWGLAHKIPVNAVKWEDIPENERSYVNKDTPIS